MDIIVTLPKWFGLKKWIAEGDPAGSSWTGEEWGWFLGGNPPTKIQAGERVYVTYNRHLIGYSPLIRIERNGARFALVRGGEAMAVTIDESIKGFQGYHYRWWDRSLEKPFPNWKDLQ